MTPKIDKFLAENPIVKAMMGYQFDKIIYVENKLSSGKIVRRFFLIDKVTKEYFCIRISDNGNTEMYQLETDDRINHNLSTAIYSEETA